MSKRQTPQLGDDPFYSVATPCLYEKPMQQRYLEKPKPPCFVKFERGREKKKTLEIERGRQHAVKASCVVFLLVDRITKRGSYL